MFNNNKNKRVNLTDVFLKSSDEKIKEEIREQPAKVFPQKNRVPLTKLAIVPHKKISKGLLALFIFFSTITVAAVLIIKNRSAKPVLNDAKSLTVDRPLADLEPRGQVLEKDSDSLKKEYGTRKNGLKQVKDVNLPKDKSIAIKVSDRGINHQAVTTGTDKIVKTQYKVRSKAFFYKKPARGNRTRMFIRWKNSYEPFNALSEENGFVYVVFTNDKKQTLEGWVRKRDLRPVQSVFYDSDLK